MLTPSNSSHCKLNPPACRRVLWMFLVHSLVCALSKNCSFARIFEKSNFNTPVTSLTSILVHSCTACCGCLTSLTSILVQSCTAWRGCLASLTSALVHNCTARCSIHGAACFTCLALLLPSPSLSQDAAMPPSPIASALHETHPRPKPWRSPSLMSPSPRHTLQERLHQHAHTHIALRTYPPLCCCTVVLSYLRFGSAHGCLTSLTSILVHSCTACCGCLTSLTSILVQSCTAWRGCLASLTSTLVHNCTARCSIHGAACLPCAAIAFSQPLPGCGDASITHSLCTT